MEFEKSSETISRNYDEALARANKYEGSFKTKSAEF